MHSPEEGTRVDREKGEREEEVKRKGKEIRTHSLKVKRMCQL